MSGDPPRRWHADYVLANIFELSVGVAAALGGLGYFLNEHSLLDASVGAALQDFAIAWSVLYFLAGVTLTLGLIRGSLRVELAGLCLFFPAALLEAVTILLFAGAKGSAPGALFAGLAVATLVRALYVWRLAVLAGSVGPGDVE
jgi:hypothetical protein